MADKEAKKEEVVEEAKEEKEEVKAEPVEKQMTKIHDGIAWRKVYMCCKADPCEC